MRINNTKRLIATALVLCKIAAFTGCTAIPDVHKSSDTDKIAITNTTKEEIDILETNLTPSENSATNPITQNSCNNDNEDREIEEISEVDKFLNTLEMVSSSDIKDLQEYYSNNYEELADLDNNDYYNMQLLYAAAAYKKLGKDVNTDVILRELNNLVVEGQIPRCMGEDEWEWNFGNLVTTLEERESLFDTYFCLAYMIHKKDCKEEHYDSEYGTKTCKVLQKEFTQKYQTDDLDLTWD